MNYVRFYLFWILFVKTGCKIEVLEWTGSGQYRMAPFLYKPSCLTHHDTKYSLSFFMHSVCQSSVSTGSVLSRAVMHFGLKNDSRPVLWTSPRPTSRMLWARNERGGGEQVRNCVMTNHTAVLSVYANAACGSEVARRRRSAPVAAHRKQVRTCFFVTCRYMWIRWSTKLAFALGTVTAVVNSNISSFALVYRATVRCYISARVLFTSTL